MPAETASFSLLTPEMCARLVADSRTLPARDGLIYSDRDTRGYEVDRARYRAAEAFVDLAPPFGWLIPLLKLALAHGDQLGMAGLRLAEMPRLLRYDLGGHFDWHRDIASGVSLAPARRVTASVQLSAPEDYDGGDLAVRCRTGAPWEASRRLGDVAMFPAALMHRAAPVTRGVRRALVFWGY